MRIFRSPDNTSRENSSISSPPSEAEERGQALAWLREWWSTPQTEEEKRAGEEFERRLRWNSVLSGVAAIEHAVEDGLLEAPDSCDGRRATGPPSDLTPRDREVLERIRACYHEPDGAKS